MQALLDKEQEDDDNLRSRLGRAWERTPSSSLSKAYRDRIAQLKGHMTAAASTDQEVTSQR